MQAAQPTSPLGSIVLLGALVLAVMAIIQSPRKVRTALYLIGVLVGAVAVGAILGLAFRSPEMGGPCFSAPGPWAVIVAALERIRYYSKSKATSG